MSCYGGALDGCNRASEVSALCAAHVCRKALRANKDKVAVKQVCACCAIRIQVNLNVNYETLQ